MNESTNCGRYPCLSSKRPRYSAIASFEITSSEVLTWNNEAQVADIYFCHGSAGLAYLYLRIYEITGEDCFRQQSEHWYAMTDERLDSSIAQFTADSPFSLLEGYPGVALTYLSRMLGKGLAWSDIFFLNF